MKEKPEVITFRPTDRFWKILKSRLDTEIERGQRSTLTSVLHELVLEAHEFNEQRVNKSVQGA